MKTKFSSRKLKDNKVVASMDSGPWKNQGSIALTPEYGSSTGPICIGGEVGRYVIRRDGSASWNRYIAQWEPLAA